MSSLVLGKSTGRLLATGGDDCRVNVWSVNKPNCVMVRVGLLQLPGEGSSNSQIGRVGNEGGDCWVVACRTCE